MAYYKLGSYVDTANCKCVGQADKNSRYLLHIPFNPKVCEGGENIIVIMLNPSSSAKAHLFYGVSFANLEDIDATTNNVLNILSNTKGIVLDGKSLKIRSVTLLNLFPYFSPNQRDINVIYSASYAEMVKNENEIAYCLSQSDNGIVLVGWGTPVTNGLNRNAYKQQIDKIKQMLHYYNCRCYEYDTKSSKFIRFDPIGRKYYVSHASRWR